MKRIYFSLLLIIACSVIKAQPLIIPDAIKSEVHFVRNQKTSAKDYILSLIDRYDIVIFCERTHDELTQYELLTDLFSDKRFINQVGHVFMEMGGSNFDEEINDYLLADKLDKQASNERALNIQRSATWYPLWERYNYHFLLTKLYEINSGLPVNKKIKLHPTDIAVRWNEIKTPEEVVSKILTSAVQDSRDSVMAANIIATIEKNHNKSGERKKYFVILNTAHATKGTYVLGNVKTKSAASYIFEKYNNRVANVLINFESLLNMYSTSIGLPETLPILDGKLDAAFELLGQDDKGFDLAGSPLENHRFENMIMTDSLLTNEKVFTGFVYFRSYPKHNLVNGVPGIIDEAFNSELSRRYKLWRKAIGSLGTVYDLNRFNQVVSHNPEGLTTYWQRVMHWIGGGKQIFSFYQTSKSIEKTIAFIEQEIQKGSSSDYNVSESGINDFGYTLISQGKLNEALLIFKFNTENYPNGWNTYDSYGEALLKAGRKEEAIRAYKKSLELNPGNENAKRIMAEYPEGHE